MRLVTEVPPPIQIFRRPHIAFCPHTGELLKGFSRLDWSEAGGEPGHSNSLIDTRGTIFGAPDVNTTVSLEKGWSQPSMLTRSDPEDRVSSVVVARGQVVATTTRGRIAIYDATSGEPRLERPLEWPDGSTDPIDPSRNVRHSPAFRGTRMVVATAHQAQFRDLRRFLFGTETDARPRLVEPEPGTIFLGAPLGVDLGAETWFCLLQGRPDKESIQNPVLRFFDLEGKQVRRCALEAIARPPVFDQPGRCLVTIDPKGIVAMLPAEELLKAQPTPTLALPDPLLQLEPEERPTLIAVRDDHRRTELWVASQLGGSTLLYRCNLEDLRQDPQAAWAWEKRDLGQLGPLSGFGVGIGSRYSPNAAGQLLAVTTSQQAVLLQRLSSSNTGSSMHGLELGSARGSFDPPLLCAAGVIARLQGKLVLDNQGIGWNSDVLHPHVAIPGTYDRAQGIAMFGRQVFIGHGLGVRSYRVVLGEKR
ncbi:MAG: hypothetical protein HC897_04625 [Thermoanaerobaculia bacterium]|nr:hypothetical protein [Thermoanaerobaculia bacterium]